MPNDAPHARLIWLATGAAWGASSLSLLVAPVSADPGAIVGLLPVVAYAVAWLLFAPSIVLVSRLAEARRAHLVGSAIAVAAAIAGSATVLANVFGVAGAAEWYGVGIVIATALLVPLAYLFAREGTVRVTAFALALFVAVGFIPAAIGGLVTFLLFVALGLMTGWFTARAAPAGLAAELERSGR